jgi:hypothetical protein
MSQYTKEGSLYFFGTLLIGEKVGVCLDYHPVDKSIRGTLLKHGVPDLTHHYFEKLKAAYEASNHLDLSEDLMYIEGPFDVDELNKTMTHTGYIATFYENFIDANFPKKEPQQEIPSGPQESPW